MRNLAGSGDLPAVGVMQGVTHITAFDSAGIIVHDILQAVRTTMVLIH
jgi:hypothetical protein